MGTLLGVWAPSFSAFQSILPCSIRNIHKLLSLEDINITPYTELKGSFISVTPDSVITGAKA
jgi:hypothetical protein